MAFTDVEMAILSQCAYYKHPDGAEQQSLYEFLKNNKKKLENSLGEEYTDSINQLMKKVKDKPYTIVKSMNDKHGSGFAAFAIKDPQNEVTVACRGTEGFSLDYDSKKDVYADGQLAYTLQTNQQAKMQEFMEELQKDNYDGYYFTGHSLGGNLAMYGAICLKDPDKLKGVMTFNAPGFNSAFLQLHRIRIKQIEDRFTNYQNERDCVSESFEVPGKVVVLECKGLDFLNILGINAHGLNYFVIKKGEFKKNHTGRKDTTVVGWLLDNFTKISDGFMGVILPGIAIYDFFVWSYKKAKEYIKSLSTGYKYASANPQIIIDTYKLRAYAQKLQSINRRINTLDRRLDSLYTKVGLLDLWNLIQADVLTGYSWRLNRCASYLYDTASSFENVESMLTNNL